MMRVNLLPPEMLERRKSEKRFGWVIIGAVFVAVVLAGVWGFAYLRLQAKQDELASLQQQVQSTQAQADQLAIFEARAVELESRRATAALAMAGRIDWAKLMNEISLVLPSDLWVQTLTLGEEAGVSMTGYAVDPPTDSPDVGHKAIAKALVRLAELDDLYDVWLINSAKVQFEEQAAIQFSITAGVKTPTGTGAQ